MYKRKRTLTILLAMIGTMFMKWTSVLFSDLRKKLGNQIVGTSWKGRGVFRAYVIPANPRTIAQTANRLHQAAVLQLYQANVGAEPGKVAEWNEDALPRRISGYNLFTKLGRTSKVNCDAEGETNVEYNGTYTIGKDLSSAGLYVMQVSNGAFTEVIAPGAMEAGEDVEWGVSVAPADTYRAYIVDGRAKVIPPTDAMRQACVNSWEVRPLIGDILMAECIVSDP